MAAIQEFHDTLGQYDKYKAENKLEFFRPYPYQHVFYGAHGYGTDHLAEQRCLMAANQVGKTTCEGAEVAIHATGLYGLYHGPQGEPWPGHRLRNLDGVIQVGSTTDTTVRDRCQFDLCGNPEDPNSLGTGWIPKKCIINTTRKPGVPNAFDAVTVRHVSGQKLTIKFKSYEQGAKKHMGSRIIYGWCDEEPPADIWSQYMRGTIATGGVLALTMTPEEGMTQIVYEFLNDIKPGQALVRATWDDAPHMTPQRRERALAQFPENEREMRSKGVPQVGAGLIFPVTDERIVIDPIPLADYWPRICGIDFGTDHPFGAAWLAVDRESDTVYVYDCYRERKALVSTHVSTIKKRGDWIPVSWPQDGWQTGDKAGGEATSQLYRNEGLFMLPWHATNPPAAGAKEGSGGNAVEPGLIAMREAMEEGRFKVFSNCVEWLEERRTYHRDVNGKIVKKFDDTISASRYAYIMRRFASTRPLQVRQQAAARGLRNW